jgi:PAS domain S-box-containing protein
MFFHKKPSTPDSGDHQEGLKAIVSDLRQSVAWTDLVFAHISESICVVSRDGSIKFANDAFATLIGETRILLLGKTIWNCMFLAHEQQDEPADDAEADTHASPLTASTLDKAWSEEAASSLDGIYHFKGRVVSLSAHYVAGIDQMILVIRDISDAEQTRLEALEINRHLQLEQTRMLEVVAKDEAMLRSIGDAVIAIDKSANLVLMNSSAERLFGLDAAKVTGKPAVDVLQFYDEKGNLVPPEQRMLIKALKTGERQGNEEEARSFYHLPNGTAIALALKITPVILKGVTIGAIGIYRDITHAREIDRVKTEFISLASHQLRTPLSSIKWYSEMLLDGDAGELTPEQIEFAKNIAQSTDRMIQLVSSLLNISRLESGRIIIDPKPTDLNELVRDTIHELHELIEEKHQNLIVSVHENLPKINLDQRLTYQVYLNLLTNAVKYTPVEGEITILISADDDNIISQISDNGIGIAQDQQAKLFTKFFRAENAIKVETDGNGLGLYLVKAIVESSGGKVWFKSEEGKGSSFWFSLPKSGMKPQQGEVVLETHHAEPSKIT